MSSTGGLSRKSLNPSASSLHGKKKTIENGVCDTPRKSFSSPRSVHTAGGLSGERTVKRLRLSKALTSPETTSIHEACRRMASRRVDALLLTDSNALLCGILTDKDVATRVIARELSLDEPVSKVMTRNPIFVLSDTLAVDALQKMVQGKFRHLPVVENGEVIALLDIAKCLYDAIARLERVAEKGKAIAAAVEGVEKQWGTPVSGPNSTLIEALREKLFKPFLSTIIPENSKVVIISPSDTVLSAAKKMLEFRSSAAVVTVENRTRGILTSKDLLMRVIAQNLAADSTLVEKVMTPNPECAMVDTSIVDALHTMHDGKFLHLPVVDRDGSVVAVIDVIHITHAAMASVGSSPGVTSEATSAMMHRFWDSAMALSPLDDDEEIRSEGSLKVASDGGETGRSYSSLVNTFGFKIEDKRGRMHRFNCDTRSLADLVTGILQRLGGDIDPNSVPQILYEDEDRDKVVLSSDADMAAAIDHARLVGWKTLKLHLDYSRSRPGRMGSDVWATAYSAVAAGAAVVAGLGLLAYLKRSSTS